jgi:hypothetical protein
MLCEFLVRGERLAQLDEGAHDMRAHFHRTRGIEDGSRHQYPVLGEGERHHRGKPELPEVVTIRNHLVALGAADLEEKIGYPISVIDIKSKCGGAPNPRSSYAARSYCDRQQSTPSGDSRFPKAGARATSISRSGAQFRSGRGAERGSNRRVRKTRSDLPNALSSMDSQAYKGWSILSGFAFLASFRLTLTEIKMHRS